MSETSLDLNLIPYLVAMEDTRNVSRAAEQLGVSQPLRVPAPRRPGIDHVVIDQHVQCGQEGIEVCRHNQPSMPSPHVRLKPTRRHNKESFI